MVQLLPSYCVCLLQRESEVRNALVNYVASFPGLSRFPGTRPYCNCQLLNFFLLIERNHENLAPRNVYTHYFNVNFSRSTVVLLFLGLNRFIPSAPGNEAKQVPRFPLLGYIKMASDEMLSESTTASDVYTSCIYIIVHVF